MGGEPNTLCNIYPILLYLQIKYVIFQNIVSKMYVPFIEGVV